LTFQSTRLRDRLTDWHRMLEQMHRDLDGIVMDQRQVDGLVFAMHTGQITRADYIELTGVSAVTASRDLAWLVQKGTLIPEGKTRSRIYRFPKTTTEAKSAPSQKSTQQQAPLPLLDQIE